MTTAKKPRPPIPMAIRSARPSDRPVIYSAFTRENVPPSASKLTGSLWNQSLSCLLDTLLAGPGVSPFVAVQPEDDDQIFGFIIAEPTSRLLHFVWTKPRYRRGRVATRLTRWMFPGDEHTVASIWSPDLDRLQGLGVWYEPGALAPAVRRAEDSCS